MTALPPFDKDTDVLLFFKLYDPRSKKIHYCGHHYMPVVAKVRKLKFQYIYDITEKIYHILSVQKIYISNDKFYRGAYTNFK